MCDEPSTKRRQIIYNLHNEWSCNYLFGTWASMHSCRLERRGIWASFADTQAPVFWRPQTSGWPHTCLFYHDWPLWSPTRGILHTSPVNTLRRHRLKLYHRHFRLNRRGAAFSVRIVNNWNKLPPSLINAPSVTSFTNALDSNWDRVVRLFSTS